MNLRKIVLACLISAAGAGISCKKGKTIDLSPEPKKPEYVAIAKRITYKIKETNFRLNYVDSTGKFLKDVLRKDSMRYEFKRGSGAGIGFSVSKEDSTDTIYFWEILVDGKPKANSEGAGGAYFIVPYN